MRSQVSGTAKHFRKCRFGGQLLQVGIRGSLLGKHLDFTPRCRLAAQLASRFAIHAATDISDSLAIDLNEIALQSKLGVTLYADRIPIAEAAKRLSATSGRAPLEHALYDGEDFELLLSVSPETAAEILADTSLESKLAVIGQVHLAPQGVSLRTASGKLEPLTIKGYEH